MFPTPNECNPREGPPSQPPPTPLSLTTWPSLTMIISKMLLQATTAPFLEMMRFFCRADCEEGRNDGDVYCLYCSLEIVERSTAGGRIFHWHKSFAHIPVFQRGVPTVWRFYRMQAGGRWEVGQRYVEWYSSTLVVLCQEWTTL